MQLKHRLESTACTPTQKISVGRHILFENLFLFFFLIGKQEYYKKCLNKKRRTKVHTGVLSNTSHDCRKQLQYYL